MRIDVTFDESDFNDLIELIDEIREDDKYKTRHASLIENVDSTFEQIACYDDDVDEAKQAYIANWMDS